MRFYQQRHVFYCGVDFTFNRARQPMRKTIMRILLVRPLRRGSMVI
jgi:hypothetical protein